MNLALLISAMGIGIVHTMLAPNHYLPFVIIAKVRGWSYAKTIGVTLLCGLAHIISSVSLGLVGVALGFALSSIEIFDGYRANVAAWALILFGLVYMVWGMRHAVLHHNHHHHIDQSSGRTVLALFIIFLITPCEVWLPFMMASAIEKSYIMISLIAAAFSLSTVITMCAMVSLGFYGFKFISFKRVEKYGHAFAGAVILICGVLLNLTEVLGHGH